LFSAEITGTLFCNQRAGIVLEQIKVFAIMAITLRLSEEQEEYVSDLKKFLNMKSSSKALLFAAKEHKRLVDELERVTAEKRDTEYKLSNLRYSVNNYKEAREELFSLAEGD